MTIERHKDIEGFLDSLDRAEITVAEWSRQKKLPLTMVYQVLQGRVIGRRGTARQIVKAMGIPLPARRRTAEVQSLHQARQAA